MQWLSAGTSGRSYLKENSRFTWTMAIKMEAVIGRRSAVNDDDDDFHSIVLIIAHLSRGGYILRLGSMPATVFAFCSVDIGWA